METIARTNTVRVQCKTRLTLQEHYKPYYVGALYVSLFRSVLRPLIFRKKDIVGFCWCPHTESNREPTDYKSLKRELYSF